jgi:hypothetical protein
MLFFTDRYGNVGREAILDGKTHKLEFPYVVASDAEGLPFRRAALPLLWAYGEAALDQKNHSISVHMAQVTSLAHGCRFYSDKDVASLMKHCAHIVSHTGQSFTGAPQVKPEAWTTPNGLADHLTCSGDGNLRVDFAGDFRVLPRNFPLADQRGIYPYYYFDLFRVIETDTHFFNESLVRVKTSGHGFTHYLSLASLKEANKLLSTNPNQIIQPHSADQDALSLLLLTMLMNVKPSTSLIQPRYRLTDWLNKYMPYSTADFKEALIWLKTKSESCHNESKQPPVLVVPVYKRLDGEGGISWQNKGQETFGTVALTYIEANSKIPLNEHKGQPCELIFLNLNIDIQALLDELFQDRPLSFNEDSPLKRAHDYAIDRQKKTHFMALCNKIFFRIGSQFPRSMFLAKQDPEGEQYGLYAPAVLNGYKNATLVQENLDRLNDNLELFRYLAKFYTEQLDTPQSGRSILYRHYRAYAEDTEGKLHRFHRLLREHGGAQAAYDIVKGFKPERPEAKDDFTYKEMTNYDLMLMTLYEEKPEILSYEDRTHLFSVMRRLYFTDLKESATCKKNNLDDTFSTHIQTIHQLNLSHLRPEEGYKQKTLQSALHNVVVPHLCLTQAVMKIMKNKPGDFHHSQEQWYVRDQAENGGESSGQQVITAYNAVARAASLGSMPNLTVKPTNRFGEGFKRLTLTSENAVTAMYVILSGSYERAAVNYIYDNATMGEAMKSPNRNQKNQAAWTIQIEQITGELIPMLSLGELDLFYRAGLNRDL